MEMTSVQNTGHANLTRKPMILLLGFISSRPRRNFPRRKDVARLAPVPALLERLSVMGFSTTGQRGPRLDPSRLQIHRRKEGDGGRSNKRAVLGRKVLCVPLQCVKQVLHTLTRPAAHDAEVLNNRGPTIDDTNELIAISEVLELTPITPD